MSFPKNAIKPYFRPRHQLLYERMNPILKMLCDVSQASQSFLVLWDEDYQQLYEQKCNRQFHFDIDSSVFKSRFCRLNPEVICVPDIKWHTLFQNIEVFKSYVNEEQLLLYPIVDIHNVVKGVVGIILQPFCEAFESLSDRVEAVGVYLTDVYKQYLVDVQRSSSAEVELDDLPCSIVEFEINQDQKVSYCNFSKNLLKKHPAFSCDCSSADGLAKVLGMSIEDFYGTVSKISHKHNMEYVYANPEKNTECYLLKLHLSHEGEGSYKCIGVVENFTLQKAYDNVLDQIIFDISHVMRRPVVTMKGLTNLIDMEKFEKEDLLEIANKIKTVSEEMEEYIKAMFKLYQEKQEAIYILER